jgi:hypothetical protein
MAPSIWMIAGIRLPGDVMQTQVTSGSPPLHTWAVPIDSKTGIASRVVMNGNPGLDVQASVDLDGLKKLQAMTEKYQGIS